jgi:hypothetical protein
MKTLIRIALLALAATVAACDTVQALRALPTSEDLQSSGTAKMDNSLSTLALAVNGNYAPEGAGAPPAQAQADIRQFAGALARRFPDEFPDRLKPYGVEISAPGRGVPLLRLYIADGRGSCDESGRLCRAEARIDGSLIDSSGKRAWWFTYWLDVSDPDTHTWKELYQRILDAMAKDQVVTRD